MSISRSFRAFAVALACMVAASPAGSQSSPATSGSASATSQQQLDSLLAPIALYPDALLTQILMASTYPLEVVMAARWSKANPGVTGKALEDAMQKQSWDPSVKGLTAVPKVLERMGENIDWMHKLGDAFLADQATVLQTVQALRRKAMDAGNLKSTQQQVVRTEVQERKSVIIIEPANPEVVYVPTYDPYSIYGPWWYSYPPYYMYPPGYYYAPGMAFAAGVFWGAAIWGGANWGGNSVHIDHHRYNNFNRSNVGNGNWGHHVDHRRGVSYGDSKVAQKYNRGGDAASVRSRGPLPARAPRGRSEVCGRIGPGACKHGRPGRRQSRRRGARGRRFRHARRQHVARRGERVLGLELRIAIARGEQPRERQPRLDGRRRRSWRRGRTAMKTMITWLAMLALALAPAGLAAQEKKAAPAAKAAAQRSFATPEEAARALVDAVRANDRQGVLDVVGAKARTWLMTPDEVADREEGRLFIAAYDAKNSVVMSGEGRAKLAVGEDSWEFPAPIVRHGGKWSFDAEAGREEILNRRVGRNELDTIQTLLAIVDAQREFAAADADGNGLRDYASRFASTAGKKDGLYWETREGEPPSPLGLRVAKAVREGYGDQVKAGRVEPYQGYLYRMLTAQGPSATGGAYDYFLDGKLFGGFAVLAYPAEYGNSGVKSFIVNHEGVVYEKDLGPATAGVAAKIRRFDPDKTWTKAP